MNYIVPESRVHGPDLLRLYYLVIDQLCLFRWRGSLLYENEIFAGVYSLNDSLENNMYQCWRGITDDKDSYKKFIFAIYKCVPLHKLPLNIFC